MCINLEMNAPRIDCTRIKDFSIETICDYADRIIHDPIKLRAALERIMVCDSSACASILGYFLDDIKDYYSLFCPLGYRLYKAIGHELRDNPEALNVAIETGLICTAIQTHIDCALDGWSNWNCMKRGLLRILEDPRLRVFVRYSDRVFIENLADIEEDEDEEENWYETVKKMQELLKYNKAYGY